ncbi:NUDIX domain-containing protein [Metabacillus arenae]|uniref:NUDIX hydrolase n=1 Tax=Metabacillus arenae TaxID=2771434 RepID=A0A926RY51_9BACI|nr:NUDIX hydrolase [Metabacillus arenae]MBD1380837.1 NUDIX hydrolase [Metabacillus arenae]
MTTKRGNVWLAVSGIVENDKGEWLVVKKTYGGLKGNWSFPAGFVKAGETVDQAIKREIQEETGIQTEICGLIGVRSGVIGKEISDNMLIFRLHAKSSEISPQEKEVSDVKFKSREELAIDQASSLLVVYFAETGFQSSLNLYDTFNPGKHFGYESYHLFF